MTVEEFFNRCRNFDWHYTMSDDPRVFRAGIAAERELVIQKDANPLFEKIHKAWQDYNYSGPAYETERLPEPKLSDFI